MAEQLNSVPCYTCKTPIRMTDEVNRVLRESCMNFYCLYGHANAYRKGKTDDEVLRDQLAEERRLRQRAEQNVAYWRDDAGAAREQAEHERRRANGYKGHAAKITKRAKAGVCPCCNRHFVALERHMATKHPTFTADARSRCA